MGTKLKGVVVELYETCHIDAVEACNQRLRQGNQSMFLPDSPIPHWLPRGRHDALYQEPFVACDGEGAMRGGFMLKWQPFWLRGKTENFAAYQMPISEGVVDRTYAMIGVQMLKDALRRSPYLFMLGMGGRSQPAAKLLAVMQWSLIDCPFFFHVVRPYRFLRGMSYLRARRSRRLLLDVAAFTGLGSLGIRGLQWLRRRVRPAPQQALLVDEFGDWADRIWEASRDSYALIAQRDAEILNLLYPLQPARFIRLRVHVEGKAVGWAVLLNTLMQKHNYFGNMRVGSIVDCLAIPGHETTVVAAARAHLASGGVDIVVTNQLSPNWCEACRADGFLSGPSNFALAVSPVLAEKLQPMDVAYIHMTRGDGDGPINL